MTATVLLCGAAVLVIELVSARHMAPFYGSSLAVWTSVIGVSLGALALGYTLGGRLGDALVTRGRAMTGLAGILAFAAVTCALIPTIGPGVMEGTQGLGLIGGTLVSAVVLIVPPLGALGMVGPYAIRIATTQLARAGRTAGQMFAISTVGSILATLATGFWLLPVLGVRWTCFATGLVLAVLALVAMFLRGRPGLVMGGTLVMAIFFVPAALGLNRPVPKTIGGFTILEISEGLIGQVKVVESADRRFLLLDGIYQTAMNRRDESSAFAYVHVVCGGLSGRLRERDRLLVVGLGGGLIPSMLARMGFQVTAVDFDPRMAGIARRHFGMPPEVKDVVADGRQYLRQLAPGSFDAIVLDAFTGEREPVHLLTREALEECRRAVEPDGIVVLNVLMYVEQEDEGLAFAGLMRTIREAGLSAVALATGPDEEHRNIVIFATPLGAQPWRPRLGGLVARLGAAAGPLRADCENALRHEVRPKEFAQAPLYTDDRSMLDLLNRRYNEAWRRGQMRGALPREVLLY